MDLNSESEFEDLSGLLNGISNRSRLAILIGLDRGYTPSEIADFLGLTRGGVHNNITKMIEADLVYRPQQEDEPTFRLTALGRFFADFIHENADNLLEALESIDTVEEEVREEVEEQKSSILGETLSDKDIKKAIHTQKWVKVDQEVEKIVFGSKVEKKYEDVDRITVGITESLPVFVGVDNREYDLNEGDVVQLPEEDAYSLIDSGVAVRLDDMQVQDSEEFDEEEKFKKNIQ